jgi:hypothetical protein
MGRYNGSRGGHKFLQRHISLRDERVTGCDRAERAFSPSYCFATSSANSIAYSKLKGINAAFQLSSTRNSGLPVHHRADY